MPLLLFGPGGDPPEPTVSMYADYAATIEDVELYLVAPDLVSNTEITRQVTEINLLLGPLGQDILSIKASLSSDVCNATYGTTTAIRDDWEDWWLMLYVRGRLKFDGPVVGPKTVWAGYTRPDEDFEHPGSHVELIAEGAFSFETRRRYVATENGGQYVNTDTPNRIFCDLVRRSMVYGSTITPADWQQGSETIDDLGPTSVVCAMPTAVGTPIPYVQDFGHNLQDALTELCNMPSADADKLWPRAARAGTVVGIDVLRGRSGASRQIGADHTTSSADPIEVSADRGNLLGYSRETDRTKKENHIALVGEGEGTGQRRRYRADLADIALHGIYAGFEVIDAAHTDEELDLEGDRLLFERAHGLTKEEFTVGEVQDFQWPLHFDIADSLAIVVPVGEKDGTDAHDPRIVETNIVGLEWSLVAPGPARTKLTLGQWPRTPERDLGRAGGGLTCGRGGGGRPRTKRGAPRTDPDAHRAWTRINTQFGDPLEADNLEDELDIEGRDTADYARVQSYGANDDQVQLLVVVSPVVIGSPETTTHKLTFRGEDGRDYTVNSKQGGSSPSP
jgi:hypothetical protein